MPFYISVRKRFVIADGNYLKALLNHKSRELPKFLEFAVRVCNNRYVLFGVICCDSKIIIASTCFWHRKSRAIKRPAITTLLRFYLGNFTPKKSREKKKTNSVFISEFVFFHLWWHGKLLLLNTLFGRINQTITNLICLIFSANYCIIAL